MDGQSHLGRLGLWPPAFSPGSVGSRASSRPCLGLGFPVCGTDELRCLPGGAVAGRTQVTHAGSAETCQGAHQGSQG